MCAIIDSRTSVESGFVFPAQSNVRQSFNERRRSNKHASNCAFSRRRTKTTELSSAGMSSVRQSLSHFELTTAQIFLYDGESLLLSVLRKFVSDPANKQINTMTNLKLK